MEENYLVLILENSNYKKLIAIFKNNLAHNCKQGY